MSTPARPRRWRRAFGADHRRHGPIDPATGEWTYTLDNAAGGDAVPRRWRQRHRSSTPSPSPTRTAHRHPDRHHHHHRHQRRAGHHRRPPATRSRRSHRGRPGGQRRHSCDRTGDRDRHARLTDVDTGETATLARLHLGVRPPMARMASDPADRRAGPTRSTTAAARRTWPRATAITQLYTVTVTDEQRRHRHPDRHHHHHRHQRRAGASPSTRRRG